MTSNQYSTKSDTDSKSRFTTLDLPELRHPHHLHRHHHAQLFANVAPFDQPNVTIQSIAFDENMGWQLPSLRFDSQLEPLQQTNQSYFFNLSMHLDGNFWLATANNSAVTMYLWRRDYAITGELQV